MAGKTNPRDERLTHEAWQDLWAAFVRANGERRPFFYESTQWLHCRICGLFAKKRDFKRDIMRRRRWEWHHLECARRGVCALPPIAAVMRACMLIRLTTNE